MAEYPNHRQSSLPPDYILENFFTYYRHISTDIIMGIFKIRHRWFPALQVFNDDQDRNLHISVKPLISAVPIQRPFSIRSDGKDDTRRILNMVLPRLRFINDYSFSLLTTKSQCFFLKAIRYLNNSSIDEIIRWQQHIAWEEKLNWGQEEMLEYIWMMDPS